MTMSVNITCNELYVNATGDYAREHVRKLLCTQDGSMDCECMACRAFRNNCNIDLLNIDVTDKEQTQVSNFRNNLSIFYSNAKNMSNNKVVFVRDIDKLSEICQNALLIFVEEHNNEAVMIATTSDENRVIPTVRSRMTVRRINLGMSHEEFEKYCFSKCIGESDLYFALTSGNIGKIDSVGSQIGLWKGLIAKLPYTGKMKEVFKILHLVKEKDKEAFADRHPELLEPLFNLIENIFFECIKVQHGDNSYLVKQCDWAADKLLRNIMLVQQEKEKLTRGFYKSNELAVFFIKLYA